MSSCNRHFHQGNAGILYQIGFECQVATVSDECRGCRELYQIGFECQVATNISSATLCLQLYQIGFECQVATKNRLTFYKN